MLEANCRAAIGYRPRPYDGAVTLLRASEASDDGPATDPTLGWGPLVAGGLEIHALPGDHFGPVSEPHVVVIADILRRCLAAAE